MKSEGEVFLILDCLVSFKPVLAQNREKFESARRQVSRCCILIAIALQICSLAVFIENVEVLSAALSACKNCDNS